MSQRARSRRIRTGCDRVRTMPSNGVIPELNPSGSVPRANGHEMMRWLAVSQFTSRSLSESDAPICCQVTTSPCVVKPPFESEEHARGLACYRKQRQLARPRRGQRPGEHDLAAVVHLPAIEVGVAVPVQSVDDRDVFDAPGHPTGRRLMARRRAPRSRPAALAESPLRPSAASGRWRRSRGPPAQARQSRAPSSATSPGRARKTSCPSGADQSRDPAPRAPGCRTVRSTACPRRFRPAARRPGSDRGSADSR